MGGTRCNPVLGSKEGSEGGCWLQMRPTGGEQPLLSLRGALHPAQRRRAATRLGAAALLHAAALKALSLTGL